MVAQLVDGVEVKVEQALQLRLADGNQFCPQQLFAQQHAQHGRLLGVLQGMVVKCTRAELALAENSTR